MADHKVLIRIMGESDIVDVNLIKTAVNASGGSALLSGLNRPDQINLLGIRIGVPTLLEIRLISMQWHKLPVML